jgi:dephospho-CoA kinase
MQKIIDQSDKNLLIFEIPLLFEAGLQSAFDLTVNISVNKQVQQKRLQARDDISPEQQKQRMESQMGNDEKNEKADLVIDNNGSWEQLYNELYKLKLIIEALPRKPIDRLSDL